MIDKCAIRVFIIWNIKEDLSTIKVSNILPNSTHNDLTNIFNPYGTIINIEIINNTNHENDNTNDNNTYAIVSYSKVDYALQATQELNHNIIGSDHKLSVTLMNPDARVKIMFLFLLFLQNKISHI